jgi:hypothetical protein
LYWLSSGAALVNAAPLLRPPASIAFSQHRSPLVSIVRPNSFNYQHLSPLISDSRLTSSHCSLLIAPSPLALLLSPSTWAFRACLLARPACGGATAARLAPRRTSALRYAVRGHRRPYGAAGGERGTSRVYNRKNRVSGFIFLIFIYLLSAVVIFSQRLSSGAALVQAAPLLQQPAASCFSQRLAPRRSFTNQHPSPLASIVRPNSFNYQHPSSLISISRQTSPIAHCSLSEAPRTAPSACLIAGLFLLSSFTGTCRAPRLRRGGLAVPPAPAKRARVAPSSAGLQRRGA